MEEHSNLNQIFHPPQQQKKSKTKRVVIVFSLILFLGVFSWLGFKIWGAASKIISGNLSGGAASLLGLNSNQLKGEGDGRVNILLLGMGGKDWPGGELTDTMMVVSIDPKNKDVALLSVPRDLYVKIPNNGYNRINAAHAFGESSNYPGGGPALAKETISSILDIPIHYFVRVDFSGFKKIVDTLGGITVDVDKDIYDPYYPSYDGNSYQPFYIPKGTQEMDGDLALRYSRSRQTTSDFDRAARQQKVMLAIKEKALSMSTLLNPSKISSLLDAFSENFKTDLQIWEIKRLYDLSKEIDSTRVVSKVLDNGPGGFLISETINGMYVLVPQSGDFSEIQQFVRSFLVDSYIKDENATIEIVNGTYKNGLAKEVGDLLLSYNYNVVKISNSSEKYDQTLIYDYTGGEKPYTLKYLSNRFGSLINKEKTNSPVDFKIILGDDYKR